MLSVWNGRTQVCPKVNLVRFADDFIITGATRELLEDKVKPLVETFLRERGLDLSPEKTVITPIAAGFDFLGQNVRKYHGKLLIKPAAKSIKAFLRSVRTVIKANKSTSAGALICQLNPLIRGWAMYHRHAVSSQTFHSVDHAIFQSLWRWAKRRHPTKGRRWIKARYFPASATRNWVFSGDVRGPKGQPLKVHLYAARSVPIKRHTKIDNRVNPYDPQWESYLEERLGLKMAASLHGRGTLLYLWKRQHGRCAHCGQAITGSGDPSAARTPRTTACYSIPPAIDKSTTAAVQPLRRIPSPGCLERLELLDRKRSRAVLRGGANGNAGPLPDTMRLTVLRQCTRGLAKEKAHPDDERTLERRVDSVKHYLWHGNVADALTGLAWLEEDLDCWDCDDDGHKRRQPDSDKAAHMCTYVQDLATYITNNACMIVTYGERYRCGERISSGFAESTINHVVSKRMVKKQQMQWTPEGAHLLLQVRTQVLNGDWEATFRTWYPGFRSPIATHTTQAAA